VSGKGCTSALEDWKATVANVPPKADQASAPGFTQWHDELLSYAAGGSVGLKRLSRRARERPIAGISNVGAGHDRAAAQTELLEHVRR